MASDGTLVLPNDEIESPEREVAIAYEDEHLLVVDKPAGIAVHAGHGRPSGTLVDILKARYPQLADLEPPDRPGIVHRIDMDTSGLLLVALTPATAAALSDSIRNRQVERHYLSLVDGVPELRAAIIDGAIGRDETNPTHQAIDPFGRHARTRYAVVQTYSIGTRALSLLHLKLESGRMHQIRVHLQAIGHPVIGDQTYRGRDTGLGLRRQFLHAHRLEFVHPMTSEDLSIQSALPYDLAEFLDRCSPAE